MTPETRSRGLGREIAVWAGFTIVTSLLICAGVVALHLSQTRALDRSAGLIRDFRQARIDLYQGLQHLDFGAGAALTSQRAQGMALLEQALAEFERSLAGMHGSAETRDAFAARLRAFRALLPAPGAPPPDLRREVELRAAFHQLDRMAIKVDANARERLLQIRAEQERVFLAVLALAVLLLAAVSAGMVWSGRRRAESEAARADALHRAQVGYERFEKIFNASPVAASIVTLDDAMFVAVNDAACRLYSYARENLVGRSVDELGIWADPAQRDVFLQRLRDERRIAGFEMRFRVRSGEVRDGLLNAERIEFLEKPCLLTILNDITERKRYEARIAYLATHDGLTDLPNRNLIHDRLTQSIVHARRAKRSVALMFVDLDRFKVLNDAYGHAFGNIVLKAAGKRMLEALRDGDTVARPYGDEFLVLLSDLANPEDASAVAQKVLDALARPIPIEGREIRIAASIGVTIFPRDGEDANTLISNADVAMYRAKALGGGTYQLFSREMSEETRGRIELETRLQNALQRNQFRLVYQPKVSLSSGRIEGCEALLRWDHPELGAVPPASFIPIAEASGMIVPIGDWVLRTACAQNKAWQDAGLPPVVVSVNLSARQFLQQDVAGWVLRVLTETRLDPRTLELELTESMIAQDVANAIRTVKEIKAAGVRVSVDDFGTGYSSLGHVKRFQLDTLKIDQSFVKNMLTERDDATIATAVISLAHSLGMTVVAEGVETPEQCAFLRRRRCDAIQGYYFSPPVPAEQFRAMLAERKSLPL